MGTEATDIDMPETEGERERHTSINSVTAWKLTDLNTSRVGWKTGGRLVRVNQLENAGCTSCGDLGVSGTQRVVDVSRNQTCWSHLWEITEPYWLQNKNRFTTERE